MGDLPRLTLVICGLQPGLVYGLLLLPTGEPNTRPKSNIARVIAGRAPDEGSFA